MNSAQNAEGATSMRAGGFTGNRESYFERLKSVNISNLFGLSRVQGLPSVA